MTWVFYYHRSSVLTFIAHINTIYAKAYKNIGFIDYSMEL